MLFAVCRLIMLMSVLNSVDTDQTVPLRVYTVYLHAKISLM